MSHVASGSMGRQLYDHPRSPVASENDGRELARLRRPSCIMAAAMRRLALLLPLLAACRNAPSLEDPQDSAVAHAAGPASSQMAETLRSQNHPQRTSPAQNQVPGTQPPAGSP